MKLVKSLLLGSVAAMAAAAGAQAADLPAMKAAPVNYVQICDAYGAGFFYVPGSNELCLKVGGQVQARLNYTSTGNVLALSQTYKVAPSSPTVAAYTQAYASAKAEDDFGTLVRTYIYLDARDQTPWGTARAYISLSMLAYGGNDNPSGVIGGGLPAPTPQTTNIDGGVTSTSASISVGIVQFAGLTVGRTSSFGGFYKGLNQLGPGLIEDADTVNVLAYTATFGNGFSATLSVEDHALRNNGISGLDTNSALAGGVLAPYPYHAGLVASAVDDRVPDLIGVLRVDQSWGAAQLSGGLRQNTAAGIASTIGNAGGGVFPVLGVPTYFAPQTASKTGYGIEGGVEFNLPQLAPGDQLWLQAAYADGMLDFAGVYNGDTGNLWADDTFGLTRIVPGYLRMDRDAIAVEAPNGSGMILENEKAYSFSADFLHYWTPVLRSNFYGGYVHVTPGTIARNTDWTLGGLGVASQYRIGTSLIWTAVKSATGNLDIGVDVLYARLMQTMAANPGALPTALPVGSIKDSLSGHTSSNGIEATFKVTRAF